jgi:hypothetical protein
MRGTEMDRLRMNERIIQIWHTTGDLEYYGRPRIRRSRESKEEARCPPVLLSCLLARGTESYSSLVWCHPPWAAWPATDSSRLPTSCPQLPDDRLQPSVSCCCSLLSYTRSHHRHHLLIYPYPSSRLPIPAAAQMTPSNTPPLVKDRYPRTISSTSLLDTFHPLSTTHYTRP